MEQAELVSSFTNLYYSAGARTWQNMFWMGVPVLKFPTDLWIYQEIIHSTKPDLIIETGTMFGGSALFLASLCELMGRGTVITIDTVSRESFPQHPRLEYLCGSSVNAEILATVQGRIKKTDRVMVILDSDHDHKHVLAELKAYAPLVTSGNYLIVEDTIINRIPSATGHPGPTAALQEFLPHKDFVVDPDKERFLLTLNPGGYLRRT